MKKQHHIIIGLVVMAGALFLFFSSSTMTERRLAKKCASLSAVMYAEMAKMSYCETKNDCVLLNGGVYGCNNLINKDAKWDDLTTAAEKFSGTCEVNEQPCSGALRAHEIECLNGMCASTRD